MAAGLQLRVGVFRTELVFKFLGGWFLLVDLLVNLLIYFRVIFR